MSENALPPPPAEVVDPRIMKAQFVRPDKERLTYRFLLAHAQVGHQPTAVEGAVSQDLEHSEQAYVRRLNLDVKKGWLDVDLGWVEHPGVLFIQNRAGMVLSIQPTEEEVAELKTNVVLIRTLDNEESAPFKMRAFGGFFIAELNDIPTLQIMCLAGVAPITIAVFPY